MVVPHACAPVPSPIDSSRRTYPPQRWSTDVTFDYELLSLARIEDGFIRFTVKEYRMDKLRIVGACTA